MNTARAIAIAATGVALFTQSACRDAAPAVVPPGSAPKPVEAYVAGCREVTAAGSCRVAPPATLTIWTKTATTPRAATLNGNRVEVDPETVRGGVRMRIEVSEAPGQLALRWADTGQTWQLDVGAYTENPRIAAANTLRRNGRFEDAQRELAPLLTTEALAVRAQAHGVKARIAFAAGDIRTATTAFQRSIALAQQAGSVSGEVHDRLALSFLLSHLGDYAGVENTLRPVDAYASSYPSGPRQADFYRMYAASGTHDHRRAYALGLRAFAHSERMADVPLWRAVTERLIRTLDQLGRYDEARAMLAKFIDRIPPHPACFRAPSLEVAGDLAIHLSRSPVELKKARRHLAEAIEIYESRCKMKRRYAHALGLMGQLALRANDYDGAEKWLERSLAAEPSHGMSRRLRQMQLAAELSYERAQYADAEKSFQKLVLFAKLYGAKAIERRAEVGLGRACEANGDHAGAIDAYRRAENTLEQLSFQAPLGAGRERFLRIESTGAPRLIDLLLRQRRTAEAANVARRSRARGLRAMVGAARLEGAPKEVRQRWYALKSAYIRQQNELQSQDAQEDWMLSVEQLRQRVEDRSERAESVRQLLDEALVGLGASLTETPVFSPPGPDEVFLVYHRVPDGWVGFAATAEQTTARRLGRIDPHASATELANLLLAPFRRELTQKRRVRLMPNGVLNTIDIHALPWLDGPLVASHAVSYGLDLGESATGAVNRAGRAVIIDPNPELEATGREASAASAALKARGWTVQRLSGSSAQHARLLSSDTFRKTDLMHYAGHAQYGGLDGWDSYLGQPSASLLSVLDILTLSAAPRGVILSGCETAAEAGPAGSSGLGLAQAFVVSGSRWVVASVRRIRDTHAYAVTKLLYDEQQRQHSWDVAKLLAGVQSRLAGDGSDVDWASFRVLVP